MSKEKVLEDTVRVTRWITVFKAGNDFKMHLCHGTPPIEGADTIFSVEQLSDGMTYPEQMQMLAKKALAEAERHNLIGIATILKVSIGNGF